MQPSARVMPRVVFLGDHSISTVAQTDVMLKLPAAGWKLDHVEADSEDLEIASDKPSTNNGEVCLHLQQTIRQKGNWISKVNLVVIGPNQEKEMIPVKIRYYGKSGD